MAAAVPAVVGSVLGTGVAAAAGITGIGLTIAGSIGSMVVNSLFNDTNPFDDPAGAIAGIAMGAMFSKASQGIFSGQDITVDGVESPELVQGAAAATNLSGNLYSDALSSSIEGGLSFMNDIGYDNFSESITEITTPDDFGTISFGEELSDQAFIRSINKNMSVSGAEPFTFDLGLETVADAQLTNPDLGGMLSDFTPETTNELAETFFSPSRDEQGVLQFGLDRERLDRYQSMRNLTGEPIEGGIGEEKKEWKNSFGAGSPMLQDFKMPTIPQSIQTLMGSVQSASGGAGEGGYTETKNRVVAPMIQSYQRQQQRMANIAQQTWGIQNTSRFSGLFS